MRFDEKEFLKDLDLLLAGENESTQTASGKQLYNAFSKAVMAKLHEDWERSKTTHKRRCGYLSAEFLLGRAIFSNLLNLGILDAARALLKTRGVELYDFEQVEDAALGNGGLGRLAACFLDSAATHALPLDGYGLRYRYGLFKQRFENGFQKEFGDDWLSFGDPWSVRKEEDGLIVEFADLCVRAVPYDTPVIGYKNGVVNTLRLWQSEPVCAFDFTCFDCMQGEQTAKENFKATQITAVLYPNDNTDEGKKLRLRQQYFMVSASLQDILRRLKTQGKNVRELFQYQTLQLNDTHPVLAVPELIRLLEKENVGFDDAFEICKKTFNFTNHTVLGEALERWRGEMVREILPDIWLVIEKIQDRIEREFGDREKFFIVKDDVVYMANLAIYASGKVNGVAKIHTEILKAETFKNWHEIYPDKFVNVTNGITPRRWLLLNNPLLAEEIRARIGTGFETHLPELEKLKEFIDDKTFCKRFEEIKALNKRRLAEYIRKKENVDIPTHFIFDSQIKRLHEYKRQLMNALSLVYIYNGIKEGSIQDFKPTAFLFGAKAAPGYYNAKAIIKFINEIAKKVNLDSDVADTMRVVFVQNYDVSYAEKIVCASDVSEQISMAGMEASGTGNMKFMLNGTVTLGTLDGANVEICEEAGKENNYIFGATVEEAATVKRAYDPTKLLEKNPALKKAVESLIDGTFSDGDTGALQSVYDSLTKGEEADRYLVLYDFEEYIRAKMKINADYGSAEFTKKCLYNMASAGKFSADRSVKEYAKKIWKM